MHGELIAIAKTLPALTILVVVLVKLLSFKRTYAVTRETILKIELPLLAGLCFCMAGDYLLGNQANAERRFLFGLLSFFIGYSLYTLFFFNIRGKGHRPNFPFLLAAAALSILLVSSYVAKNPGIGLMTILICLYVSMFNLMIFFISRERGSWLFMAGATLLLVSDWFLAMNRFVTPMPQSTLIVLSTYYAGQAALFSGFIRFYRTRLSAQGNGTEIIG